MGSKLAVCILGLALGACAEPRASGPPSQSTAKPSVAAAPAEGAEAVAPGAVVAPGAAVAPGAMPAEWVEAVRLERWTEAAARIDALPEAVRGRPEVRYVRARSALALKDPGRAAELLHELEAALPLLAGDVARYRAEAALEAGPFAEAAAYFARSRGALDLARAADAYVKAGDTAKAIAVAGQGVAAAQRAKRRPDEAAARMARARALRAPRPGPAAGAAAGGHPRGEVASPRPAGAAPPLAVADLRWVAKNAAGTPEGREAQGALEALKLQLSTPDRLEAVEAMIAAGSAVEAAQELERLGAEGVIPRGELLHRRATALYKARDYEGAAKAFLEAAAVRTARQPEQLYSAARALSRADRDAEAIARYLEVATKSPRTSWGEGGSYLAAHLMMQVGRYEEAAKQFERFLGRYPRSGKREDAEYERALALISSGDAGGARRRFSALAERARAGADERSRLRELEGLAARRAGDLEGARWIWSEVMRERPLSWAALMARSRLAADGAAPPPLLEPSTPRRSAAFAPVEVRLPPTAALLASIGLDGDAEGWLSANEREVSLAYPGREGEALCQMYGMLSRAARRYRVGARAVGYEALKRAPSPDDRWAWECIYPRPYVASVRALEAQHGLPQGLVHALMRQESAFDPVVVSPARAVGLMQLMPTTAASAARELEVGFDLLELKSPEVNLRLGGFYMAKLLRTFQGSLPLAAAAYNAGPRAVSQWIEAGADRDTDLWVARIPYDETRNYVGRVLANLARYQWLEGGDAAVAMVPLEIPSDARASNDAY